MDQEKVAHLYDKVLFLHKEEQNYIVCKKMNGAGD
jgi:hypothetical protein